MKKEDLFFLLDVENFTQEMAKEYFLRKNKTTIPSSAVSTPCAIAYIAQDGKLEVLPYLDLNRAVYVWGIKVDNLIFEKDEDDPCTYSKAQKIHRLDSVKNVEKFLPYSADYEKLSNHIEDFQETISILRQYGVSAAYLSKGDYWIADERGESVFIRCPKGKFVDHRESMSAHVRWVVRLN